MNQKFILHWTIALSLFIAVFTFAVAMILSHSASEGFGQIVENRHRQELSRVVEILRNDLLQGNIRGARRYLEELKLDKTIVDYHIEPTTGSAFTVSHSEGAIGIIDQPSDDFHQLVMPVYFNNQSRTSRWGTVKFTIDVGEIQTEKRRLYWLVALTAIVIGAASMLGLSLFGLQLRTSSLSIFPVLQQVSRMEYPSYSAKLIKVWGPLLSFLDENVARLRKLQEEKIEAERRSALGELATQVAHDLRSPISALKICRTESAALSPDVQTLLENSVSRVESICSTLLSSYKTSQPKRYKLLDLLEEIVSEKEATIGKPCAITFDVSTSTNITFANDMIDRTELARIISNLIDNSIEAGSANIKITLELTSAQPSSIQLLISDDGHGISSEIIPFLGRRGFSSGKSNGTGLGLYHAKKVIGELGGKVTISSQEKIGTTIAIDFPIF